MGDIKRVVKPMFYAPTKGRHYATSAAAAWAEAMAMLVARYPFSESGEIILNDERLMRVRARLAKRIHRSFRRTYTKGGE